MNDKDLETTGTTDLSDRVAVAFHELYWRDRWENRVRPLSAYVDRFAPHSQIIAREYLRLELASVETAPESLEPASALPAEGMLGRYRILEPLGRGGQGLVYLAEDPRLSRKVALKVLTDVGDGSMESFLRFQREAEAASRLDHPGLCSVYDIGRDGNRVYIAMRFVPGQTLAQKLKIAKAEENLPELRETLLLMENVARALAVAHATHVVHRDLKPANIMVTPTGDPVVLDFGLARLSDVQGATLTRTGDVFGTPHYLPPEVLASTGGPPPTPQLDIYALGITLFEALSLERPFEAPTREALYHQILNAEPQRLRLLRHDATRDLETVVATAIARDPSHRYTSMQSFADDLRAVREGRPTAARRVGGLQRLLRWMRREPLRASFAAFLLVSLPMIASLATHAWNTRADREFARAIRDNEAYESSLAELFQSLWDGDSKRFATLRKSMSSQRSDSIETIAADVFRLLIASGPRVAVQLLNGDYKHAVERSKALLELRDDLAQLAGTGTYREQPNRPDSKTLSAEEAFLHGTRFMALAKRGRDDLFPIAAEFFEQAILLQSPARILYHLEWLHAVAHCNDDVATRRSAHLVANAYRGSMAAHLGVGHAMLHSEQLLEAEQHFRAALNQDPNHPDALRGLGRVYGRLGRHNDAIAPLESVLRTRPIDETTLGVLSIAYLRTGRRDDARRVAEHVVKIQPNSPIGYICLGDLAFEENDHDRGFQFYETARSKAPELASIPYNMGNQYEDTGRFDLAEAAYRETLRLDPRYEQALVNLAGLLVANNRAPDSIQLCSSYLEKNPNSAAAHAALGGSLGTNRNHADALKHYSRAVEIEPNTASYRANLGVAHLRQGDFANAQRELEASRNLGAPAQSYAYPLGLACLNLGELDAAIQHLESAISANPNSTDVLRYLAPTLRARGYVSRALSHFRKLHELGLRKPGWNYPSETWVADCEKEIEPETLLEVLARGAEPNERPSEDALADAAKLAERRGHSEIELQVLRRILSQELSAKFRLKRLPELRAAELAHGLAQKTQPRDEGLLSESKKWADELARFLNAEAEAGRLAPSRAEAILQELADKTHG